MTVTQLFRQNPVSVHRAVTKQLLDQCSFLAALCLPLHLPKQRCPQKNQTFVFLPDLESLHSIMPLMLQRTRATQIESDCGTESWGLMGRRNPAEMVESCVERELLLVQLAN